MRHSLDATVTTQPHEPMRRDFLRSSGLALGGLQIGSFTYDMYENNFVMLKEHNLPVLDTLLPAMIDDLEQRGMLASTSIYVMGEMGRSPKINAKAGRDHWPQCGFCLMVGGGIAPGAVDGETDATGGYPISDPVLPGDIVATIYRQLGIDAHTMLHFQPKHELI